jgi:hypothetical protein
MVRSQSQNLLTENDLAENSDFARFCCYWLDLKTALNKQARGKHFDKTLLALGVEVLRITNMP